MKPADQGLVDQIALSEQCRCGVRLRDGERVLWCPRTDCPETKQRYPTEWQRKVLKMDEPFEPFMGKKERR